jgi:hypothetical protein
MPTAQQQPNDIQQPRARTTAVVTKGNLPHIRDVVVVVAAHDYDCDSSSARSSFNITIRSWCSGRVLASKPNAFNAEVSLLLHENPGAGVKTRECLLGVRHKG